MVWGAKQTATQLTAITTTEQFFTTTPTLNPREIADCEIEFNPPGTPTDDLEVNIYGTLDTTSENWDDTPLLSFTISNSIDPNKVKFKIMGIYKFRVGVKSTGSTDTTATANFNYMLDGVNAA